MIYFRTNTLFSTIFLFSFLFLYVPIIHAQTETPAPSSTTPSTPTPTTASSLSSNDEAKKKKEEEIRQLEQKVNDLQGQTKTLSNQITAMDSQIKLTELRINATKAEIAELSDDIKTTTIKIAKLESSVTDITKILAKRIVATYQAGTVPPLQVLLSAEDVSDFLDRANYLKIVQAHDKQLVYETEQAKRDYANQKEILEGKKQKVEGLKQQLEGYTQQIETDKLAKQSLLRATQNDEKKYQSLLSKARVEFESIQGIVAGNGAETMVSEVSEGQKIASIINGPSCNSGGAHVHFIVRRGGTTENPFSYLKGIDSRNCSGSSCNASDGDPFNPSGGWEWPINGPVTLNQGYGSTWAVRYSWVGQIYNFHNGIDIAGSSLEVKAVKAGTLYRGSYGGSGGCRLKYVRVKHKDDGLDTLYLHVNY